MCFVTSGLGGMSGVQAVPAIAGAACIVAESNPIAGFEKRHQQGWVDYLRMT